MPRITPGMTRGQSIIMASRVLPRNRARSSTKAFAVPRATARTATGSATLRLFAMLASMAGSRSTPGLPNTAPVPTNHSSVKPFQGGAGKALAIEREDRDRRERREQEQVEGGNVEAPGDGRAAHRITLAARSARATGRTASSPPRRSPGERKQEEAEGRALGPIEAGDELGIDCSVNHSPFLPPRSTGVAKLPTVSMNTTSAAGDDAGHGVRDDDAVRGTVAAGCPPRSQPASTRDGSRLSSALDERHHHEQEARHRRGRAATAPSL